MKKTKFPPGTGGPSESRHLNHLTEETDGHLTKRALFLQDALKYAKSRKGQGFRVQELANWLINNNYELKVKYASSRQRKSNIVLNIMQRVEATLGRLRDIGLVVPVNIVSAEKNREQTFLYDLTEEGTFVSSLMEFRYTDSDVRRKSLSDEIYDYCSSYLATVSGANAAFLSLLLKAFKEKGTFPEMVRFATSFFVRFPHNRSLDKFVGLDNPLLWCIVSKATVLNVLQTFDVESRNKVLMHFKVTLEGYYRAVPGMSAEWESEWFACRGKESKVVLEAKCGFCGKRQAATLDIVEDLETIRILLSVDLANVGAETKCASCEKTSVMPILPLGPRRSSVIARV